MAKKEKPKQVRVTFYVDEDVQKYFQDMGEKDDRPYSPLMARVLRNYVEQCVKADKDVAEYKTRI